MTRIYLSSCLSVMDAMIEKNEKVDLIITDPPYIVATKGGGIFKQKDKRYINEITSMCNGFDEIYLDRMCQIQNKINMYIFCSLKQIPLLLDYFVAKRGCNYNILCWHKTNPLPSCNNKYLSDTEYILFFREKGVKLRGNFHDKLTYTLLPINHKDKRIYNHPTIKPIELVDKMVRVSSDIGQTVFDPFMGSGTTGVSAINNGRNFIGCEIVPEFYNIAERRLNHE